MPYLKVTSEPVTVESRQAIARELTDTVVRLLATGGGRGPGPDELREHCTVHFAPYDPDGFAIGGRLMSERGEREVTLEFSDWGLNERRQRRLAGELTTILARCFSLESQLEHINIRFHPYPPSDFAVGGRLLADIVPWIGRIAKKMSP